jgi:hypothetical protein
MLDSLSVMFTGGTLSLITLIANQDMRQQFCLIFHQFFNGEDKQTEAGDKSAKLTEKIRLEMTGVLLKTITTKTSGRVRFDDSEADSWDQYAPSVFVLPYAELDLILIEKQAVSRG